MKYIYVFDYNFGHIYEITVDSEEYDKITNFDMWLFQNYRISHRNSDYMISNKKLEIEQINKIDYGPSL